MNTIPVAVEIGGYSFTVVDRTDLEEHFPFSWRAYREFMQPTTVQAADIAGSSRPQKSSRPDQLEWRLDDWSQGEGQKYIDFSQDGTFKQFWYSDGAVDIRTAGSLKLGYKFVQSSTLGGTSRFQGPHLVHRNGAVEAYVDDRVFQNGGPAAPDTWTNKGQASRTAGNRVAGAPRVLGGNVYAAYKDGTGGLNSSDVRRINANFSTTQMVAPAAGPVGGSNQEGAMPANNRLYVMKGNADVTLWLNRTSAISAPPYALTTVYAIDGVGSEFGIDALSSYVYVVTMHTDGEEEPHIHMYPLPNTTAGGERAFLPTGFRMNQPHATGSEHTGAYRAIVVLGDLVFVTGFKQGDTGQVDVPAIAYYSASRTGSWTIREGIITTAEHAISLLPATKSLLIIGTDGGRCFAYDIQNGGVAQLFDGITAGEDIISLDYYKGVYWAGVRTTVAGTSGGVKTYRTQIGAGQYPTTATLHSSQWDFGYPEVNKIIDEIEITTKPIPASGAQSGTVTITLYADETAITTDKLGATLVHSGIGATKTRFKISGLDASQVAVTRTCRNLRVDITLTSDTNDHSTTPEVTAVNIKVLPREFIHFYEAVVNLDDDTPGERELGQVYPRTGEQKATLLRSLKEADPPIPLAFLPRYRSGSGSRPETASTPLEVYLEDCEMIYPNKGNGFAKVTVRRVTNT